MVIARSSMAGLCFTSGDIAEACVLACAQHSNNPQLAAPLVDGSRTVTEHPAWTAKKRPASAVQQLEMQWQLPLQQLKTIIVGQHMDTDYDVVRSSKHLWQGQCFEMTAFLCMPGYNDDPCTYLALCLMMLGSDACVHNVTFELSILSASGSNQQQQAASQAAVRRRAYGTRTGDSDQVNLYAVNLGQISSRAAVEVKLRELGLVHSDGCLHIKGLVTSIV
jgi:hypothetical protein